MLPVSHRGAALDHIRFRRSTFVVAVLLTTPNSTCDTRSASLPSRHRGRFGSLCRGSLTTSDAAAKLLTAPRRTTQTAFTQHSMTRALSVGRRPSTSPHLIYRNYERLQQKSLLHHPTPRRSVELSRLCTAHRPTRRPSVLLCCREQPYRARPAGVSSGSDPARPRIRAPAARHRPGSCAGARRGSPPKGRQMNGLGRR